MFRETYFNTLQNNIRHALEAPSATIYRKKILALREASISTLQLSIENDGMTHALRRTILWATRFKKTTETFPEEYKYSPLIKATPAVIGRFTLTLCRHSSKSLRLPPHKYLTEGIEPLGDSFESMKAPASE